MNFLKSSVESLYGKGIWYKRLLCGHLNWNDLNVKDWRTDEGYWQCCKCSKVKNFGFNGMPVQWLK